MQSRLFACALPFLAVALCGASAPQGPIVNHSVTVIGNGQAQLCETHARLAADNMMAPQFAEATCTDALNLEQLSPLDRAATLNNRGVLRFVMLDQLDAAAKDFDDAIDAIPSRGESYINRGGVLILQKRYAEALKELDHGIELGGMREPWKAYYNRALAREQLEDVRGAYEDLTKANSLKPDWELPAEELKRFSVRTAAARP